MFNILMYTIFYSVTSADRIFSHNIGKSPVLDWINNCTITAEGGAEANYRVDPGT